VSDPTEISRYHVVGLRAARFRIQLDALVNRYRVKTAAELLKWVLAPLHPEERRDFVVDLMIDLQAPAPAAPSVAEEQDPEDFGLGGA
jgi:hypothetical protein